MSVTGDIQEAVDFLAGWYGSSPRQLVSIVPDGAIASKCLWPQQPADEREWIERAVAAGRNVYFHVNQPSWALDKRAEKKDVRVVRALHVDVDPRPGEDPAQCRERAMASFASFQPQPSVVVDSGGGLQGFWLLHDPVQLDGTQEKWEAVERYNIAIQVAFGADSCFNVDRIMRLPGTVNYPNKKKLAKGREVRPARIIPELTTWVRHDLRDFTQAPPVQQAGSSSGATRRGRVTVPGNLQRFASTDDLPVALQDYTKMLIVNGQDTENPNKYPSRSEVLWRVCCDMVRAGADDETIAAVIMDPDFRISSSVIDKARPELYAAEQIAAAREEAVNPALRELNARHAVIESDPGGRCVVAEEDWDDIMERWKIKYQSFDAFRNRYMHRPISIGKDKDQNPIYMPLGKWWLQQEQRRQFRKIVFWPNREVPPDQYNLWRGYGCDAKPGDRHQGLLTHIHENLCDGNQELTDYVLNWCARLIQQPDRPGEVAIVVRGRKGTGKGFLFRSLGSLLGQHFMQVASAKYVTGDFNAHLRDCCLLFADEAFFAGDKKHEGILKALITEPTLTVEAKGIDAEPSPNFLHIGVASNEDWVVPASADERRFCVLQASDRKMQNTGYFKQLQHDLDNGGRENLLHYLLRRDISEYEVRRIPRSQGLSDQKVLSQRPEEAWWYHKLVSGLLLPEHDGYMAKGVKDRFYDDYIDEMTRQGQQRRLSRPSLGKFITKMCPPGFPRSEQEYTQVRIRGSDGSYYERRARPWWYQFPTLTELRDTFTAQVGHIEDWPEVDDPNPLTGAGPHGDNTPF